MYLEGVEPSIGEYLTSLFELVKLDVSLFSGLSSMLFCTVTDDVLFNVALNKRSYQVSEYTDQFGTTHGDSLANDGNVNSCARSQRATNPWWAVDLGVGTLVAQVNLVNAEDNDGSDLHFTVSCFINFVCII